MSRVDPTATAFWRRQTPYMVSVDAIWRDAADDHKVRAWTRASIDSLREFSDGGEYVNFPGLAEDIDWSVFNVAHEDQRLAGWLDGSETFRVANMHPKHMVIEGTLPQIVAR